MSHSPPPSNDDIKAENRRRDIELLEHLEALKKDPHLVWFMEHVMGKARDKYHDDALSIAVPAEKAEQARWQHAAVKTLCGEVDRMHRECEARLQKTG